MSLKWKSSEEPEWKSSEEQEHQFSRLGGAAAQDEDTHSINSGSSSSSNGNAITTGNLLQVLVQRSPLRCGACQQCCTHSLREDSAIVVPHVKLSPGANDGDANAFEEDTSPLGRSKTYEIQVTNLSYQILPSRVATAAASLLHRKLLLEHWPDLLQTKTILHNVSCVARPGELLAIVGPSGAGKSTLLEILAGRIPPSESSTILVNKHPMDPSSFRKISGYVMQHDALFPLLTVSETLMLSAQLRLPPTMSESAKRARVELLMMELGLQHVASSRIGSDSVRGVSGGERRRVSIGVDVIHDPAVLLLDEPTSGLDSAGALQVVAMLHNMAKSHERTIILSIHQPGFRILELIHSILLLAKGRVIHSGTLQQLAEMLSAAGHRIPTQVNVVEYAIEAIDLLAEVDKGGVDTILAFNVSVSKVRSSLQDLFNQVKVHESGNESLSPPLVPEFASRTSEPGDKILVEKPTFANPWLREMLLLCDRCGKIILRTRQLSAARTLQALFAGLALGTIFLGLGRDLKGVQERYGFFAFTLTFLLTSTSEALPLFLEERQIFMRETSRGAYRVSSYVISNTLMFLPFLFIFALLYTIPTYCLVGLNHASGSYVFFLLVVWMAVVMANSVVAFFSALVPNYIMGNTFVTGTLGAFFLFSGYFVPEDRIPKYWLFMHYLSVFKYPLDAMLINEYASVADKCFGRVIGGICTLTGRDVLAQSGLENSNKWKNLAVMVAFAFAYRLLSYIVLRVKPRHRQQ